MKQSPRTAVAAALSGLSRQERYSNIVLDELLESAGFSFQDAAFVSRLFYGVIERRLTLDYVLAACSSVPLKKMHPLVLETLRVAVYQLLYMDRVPASAAVNEAVNSVRQLGQGHSSGFVNGVLHGVIRKQKSVLENLPAGDEGEAIRYSCPAEWITLWKAQYGENRTKAILSAINEAPALFLRVNPLAVTDERFAAELETAGVTYRKHPVLPHCFQINDGYLINHLASIKKNWYHYQDTASQWACLALDAKAGERIADVCAAPGGKSLTVAEQMQNTGYLLACDLYAQKCETMEKRAASYGATIIETAVRDASKPCPAQLRGSFDRVICDVPCSGLGVIRRKPEIRYKTPAQFASLPALQYAILEQSAALVKDGGVLQYSTCTLHPAENEAVAERFLREHPEFSPRDLPIEVCFEEQGQKPDHHITLFPSADGSDGFFIAGFQKG